MKNKIRFIKPIFLGLGLYKDYTLVKSILKQYLVPLKFTKLFLLGDYTPQAPECPPPPQHPESIFLHCLEL